jgi:hypothetical protein
MKEYTKEQFDSMLPEMQEDYVLDGDSYKHAGVLKMKGTLNDLNGKLESQKGEYNQLNGRLSEFESTKAQEIEQARADALEQAKSKGEVADIEKLYEERIADAEKRASAATRLEVTQEFALKNVEQQADIELTELVSGLKPKDDFAARLIKDHLKGRQRIEDGKIIYFNEDGSASALDRSGLLTELRESPMFKPLSSWTAPSEGGGLMNGGNKSGAYGKPMNLTEQAIAANKAQ